MGLKRGKLTGKAKAEFLARMAKGRRKSRRRPAGATKHRARPTKRAARKNPRARRGKLIGKAKAEFLRRMARGRRKAGRPNPKKRTRARGRKNAWGEPKFRAKPGTSYLLFVEQGPQEDLHPERFKALEDKYNLRRFYTKKEVDAVARQVRKAGYEAHIVPSKGNSRRRKNPNGEEQAAELYEQFHQKAPGQTATYAMPYKYPENFAELGRLLRLTVELSIDGREIELDGFGATKVLGTADGRNIYFLNGNQKLDLRALGIESDKDQVDIGPCLEITYHTTKGFHDFEPTDYTHEFGEDDGEVPLLAYDRLNERLYLIGGAYVIKRPGIED